ncbi:MAG: hypothetical protein K2L66_05500, partial [Paramuribaculum sp.]|nr:hypothetical protein [Paramuribaculum sp.]
MVRAALMAASIMLRQISGGVSKTDVLTHRYVFLSAEVSQHPPAVVEKIRPDTVSPAYVMLQEQICQ